jgi:hypothetical protein
MTTDTNPRYGRPQQPRTRKTRKPTGLQVGTTLIALVQAAAWFIVKERVFDSSPKTQTALRREARTELVEWAMGSRMTALSLVNLAWSLAEFNGRHAEAELRSEYRRAQAPADKLVNQLEASEDESERKQLQAQIRELEVQGKNGRVINVSKGQMKTLRRYGLAFFGGIHPDQVEKKQTSSWLAGALIGEGRMHLRCLHHILVEFLLPEDKQAFLAAFSPKTVKVEEEKVEADADADVTVLPTATPSEPTKSAVAV